MGTIIRVLFLLPCIYILYIDLYFAIVYAFICIIAFVFIDNKHLFTNNGEEDDYQEDDYS
mgnify:FL=1